jgi:hypothetical protein
MTNPLDYSSKRKPASRLRKSLIALGVAGLVYVSAFELMYLNRGPAANMVYFIYAENRKVDSVCYRLFYPLYWVQRRLLNCGQTHNDDREAPVYPPGFRG